ncbi:MAG: hypothetical protein LC772_10130, partial [Chloroflexi bacterium]|nr:hypothetical protein [Chloroflexota bacterium]
MSSLKSAWRDAVPARSFTGESLREIAMPIGGIGTGTVSLGGRGQLRDWEIFNRPGKGRDLPYTFFSLWAMREGEPPVSRILERQALPPYTGGFGLPTSRAAGLPRISEATFTGFYPYAWIDFEDPQLPLEVTLEASNPFVPLDSDASGIPAAVFRWTLRNAGPSPVRATVALSLMNAVGYGGTDSAGNGFNTGNRHAPCFGQNLNEFVDTDGIRGLRMSSGKYLRDDPRFGTMAVTTDWDSVTYLTHWERAGWWDDLQNFWDQFASDGRLPNGPAPSASPEGQTDVGSLGLQVHLAPGNEAVLPFVVSWHFPNLTNYWNQEEAVRSKRLGNYYARQFEDAWAAGRFLLKNQERLEGSTRAYVETLASSALPATVIDAVSSQASIIRTTTCLRTE